jgi:hypothetical protein
MWIKFKKLKNYMNNQEIINTFDGTPAIRANCRKIQKDFYEIGRQCFKMQDNKWHRINNGKVVFDHSNNEYILNSQIEERNLIFGIVSIDDLLEPVIGYFVNNYDTVLLKSGNGESRIVINEHVAAKLGSECLSDGVFYDEDYVNRASVMSSRDEFLNRKKLGRYSFKLNYNSTNKLKYFLETSSKYFGFDDKKYQFGKELGETTYGIEVETANGGIPENKLWKAGLIVCRDGSIGGNEFVTVPMKGSMGLSMIDYQFDLLKKYTEIDHTCSMHIHFGSYKLTKEYAVSAYMTLAQLQNEVYELFPEYYANTSKFKQRDYNNPLPSLIFNSNLEDNFDAVYNYLLGVSEENQMNYPFNGFCAEEHPLDRDGNSKWHIPTRYHLYNLVPMIWGNRGTIEARIHTPTLNKTKAVAWLFINKAILEFAFKNKDIISTCDKNISRLTLSDVIEFSFTDNKLINYLNSYIKNRKLLVSNQNKTVAGRKGVTEVNDDNDFEFRTEELKNLLCG